MSAGRMENSDGGGGVSDEEASDFEDSGSEYIPDTSSDNSDEQLRPVTSPLITATLLQPSISEAEEPQPSTSAAGLLQPSSPAEEPQPSTSAAGLLQPSSPAEEPQASTSAAELLQSSSPAEEPQPSAESPPRELQSCAKSKKRTRNNENWRRNQIKQKRARGEQYVNYKNNTVPAKVPIIGPCPCPKQCHLKINEERQQQIFKDFYELQNFDLQNAFIFSLLKTVNKARSYTGRQDSRRAKTYMYHLLSTEGVEVRVCKKFFLRVLQVSDGRVTRVAQRKIVDTVPPVDRRGKQSSSNKTPDAKVTEVKDFIKRFPVYESHYTRHKSENRRYLSPDLSLTKIYSLYKETVLAPVSFHIFSKIFNESFNLHFHAPISDSCKKCDLYQNKLKCCDNDQQRQELEQEREFHQRKAQAAREGLRRDTELAKNLTDTTVITFDLMKTLPTPVLTTGIVYYKRQLWTFCFGVHNMGTDEAFMYVWDESTASRGPQEIGSCLLHFFKNFLHTKKVIMYSDQCGGQNRNIKLSLLCQYVVAHPDFIVEEIDHKFLVSGHSYLPCDQDFGLIERNKKYYKEIFVPHNWLPVISTARKQKPYKVIEMTENDFISTITLEKNITNRKISVTKSKVEWLRIQWLKFHKMHPYSIYYKYSNNETVLFEEVDVRKRQSLTITRLEKLRGVWITEKKKKDLIELLQFVPPIYHQFYQNLKTSSNAVDEVHCENSDSESD